MFGFFTYSAIAKDVDEVIADLSDSDRKTIIGLKQEFSSWPKSVRDEVRAYQDFVFLLQNQIQSKYSSLSKEAKAAIKNEEEMVSNLSPDAINTLKQIG